MTIQSSEIKAYRAATNNDSASNGGIMSANESVSGVAGNVLPPVTQAELTSGVTRHRKLFRKVANDADETLFNARAWVENFTPGDDRVLIFAGTQTDVQSDLSGSERVYGAGQLDSDVTAGATSIDVLMEAGGDDAIQNGDTVRISDKPTFDGAGNEEERTVSGAPGKAGDVYTITLDSGLDNGYLAADTRVASILTVGDIKGAYSGFTVTSAGDGAYDDTANPVELDNIGTIQDTFTLTFTSATAFDIAGLEAGALGSGNISSDTAPNNASFGKPYFTLRSAGFSGTWQAGDTIEFTTSPAAAAFWYKHIVPAGAASLTANKAIVVLDGESA